MNNEKILILVFKKSNGGSFRFSVPYPIENAEATPIKSLGTLMIDNDLMEFTDGAKLQLLEKAYYQETKLNEVSLA
ncbi:MAG: DUF2922 domain-containing protein [Peptostreptococcaceae bacterium]|nr:DUF2922 domain-containing protein [Peptostreptococcaceae bacterium]